MNSEKNLEKTLEIKTDSNYVLAESEKPLKILSSAVLNSGFENSKNIINYRVEKNFTHSNPENYLLKKLENLGMPDSTVGMLTAAEVKDAEVSHLQNNNFEVKIITTTGISNPIVSGKSKLEKNRSSTINIIVIVEGDMKDRAMIDAVRTITEAKTVALRELDIRSEEGATLASGTATDAVAIACTGEGKKAEYGGPISDLGELVGKGVRESVKNSLQKCGFNPQRSLLKRLEERGISLKQLVDTAEKAFVKHPNSEREKEIAPLLEEELKAALEDINIASLIVGGLRIEEDGKAGLIPNLSAEEYESDPVHLLADEIIGMRIANYLNGSKGVFEFERIDRKKPGILGDLGPFLDDVIGGLIGGVCSKTYEKHQ